MLALRECSLCRSRRPSTPRICILHVVTPSNAEPNCQPIAIPTAQRTTGAQTWIPYRGHRTLCIPCGCTPSMEGFETSALWLQFVRWQMHVWRTVFIGLEKQRSLQMISRVSHTHKQAKDRPTGRGGAPFITHDRAVPESFALGGIRPNRSFR